MKKLLFLLPVLIGGLMMTGCETQVVVAPPVEPAPAVVVGDPYYTYGGVNYYYEGGRYYYWRNHARIYVGGLPGGGFYIHGGHRYRHYYHGRWY
ncbi:MAG TPA: hypothetical protein VG733_02070 [Chthoniobacteraceae bacterium]|nr:hypothetical protein [Chthoniobacteraceae bacterium]